MTTLSIRPNIYKLLKEEFKVYNTIIDIGCSGLCDLMDFEYSPFKKIIGIDKYFETIPFGDYRRCKLKGRDLSQEQYNLLSQDLLKIFTERFVIHENDFLKFEFEPNAYSFIICNKVLHFYEDENKFKTILTLYNSLQKNGIIYLRINHNHHPNNTDLQKVTRLSENMYQTKEVPEEIRYLIDVESFIEKLKENYQILTKYTVIDESTLTIVLKK